MYLDEAIRILQEYVKIDRDTREKENCLNDFDKFCEEKCVAIETVVNFAIEQIKNK
jgi:hypothetical protein